MKEMKRVIGIVLCLAVCLTLLAGCGGKENTDTPSASPPASGSSSPAAPGTSSPPPSSSSSPDNMSVIETDAPPPAEAEYVDHIVVASETIAVIDLFNPAFGSAWIQIVSRMFTDSLVYCNIDGGYEPMLATDWGTEDGKVYWFKLRDDVYFHNGEHFTAADVLYTLNRAKDSPGTPMYDAVKQVESIVAVNDYEVIITLEAINVDFMYTISTPTIAMVNEKAYNDDPDKGAWIGTGPWIITSFVPTERIEFVRNDNYFGEIPVTKSITFLYVAEQTAALIMLENGEIDFNQLNAVNVPIYENDDRFVLKNYIMNNCNYLAFNMMKPITADINFRMAVAHAIDRQQIVDIAVGGYGQPVQWGTFWGYRTAFKNNDIPLIPYDLDKAREYLAKSSYKGETIELVAAMAHTIATAQVVQQNLQQIGINVTIFDTDPPSLASYVTWGHTKADIVVNSAVATLPSNMRSYLYSGINANTANYTNPVVEELLDKAFVTVDDAEREKLYYEIQEIVAGEIPYLGTMHMGMYRIEAAGCGGAIYFPNNNWDFTHVYKVKQP